MRASAKMVVKLLREAAELIRERGFQHGREQYMGDDGLTVLGALRLALGYHPRATIMEMGGTHSTAVSLYTAALQAIHTRLGARSFTDWCEDRQNTQVSARKLLGDLALVIETKDIQARILENLNREKTGHGHTKEDETQTGSERGESVSARWGGAVDLRSARCRVAVAGGCHRAAGGDR